MEEEIKMEMEKEMKHLEFVQNVITRMNTNSFQVKGWAITIVSALLALFANSSNSIYIFVAIVPTLVFWFLDAYYLLQERKFRGLYNDIIDKKVDSFYMPICNYKYDKKDDNSKKYCYWNVFKSTTIAPLYGVLILGLITGGILLEVFN